MNVIEENRKFWINEITVNGDSYATWKLIGEEEGESDYCDYILSGVDTIDYEDIEAIDFQIEVDDDDNNEIGSSKTVRLKVDTDAETFKTTIE